MSLVPLPLLKAQLRILDDAENDLLQSKLDSAEAWAGHYIGKPLAELAPLPADIREAVLQLAAHWFENREAVLVDASAGFLPFGVTSILSAHQEWGM